MDDQVGGAAGQILEKKNKVATNQRRYEFYEFAQKINAIIKHSIKGQLQIKHRVEFCFLEALRKVDRKKLNV